jgi:hypothetical protein
LAIGAVLLFAEVTFFVAGVLRHGHVAHLAPAVAKTSQRALCLCVLSCLGLLGVVGLYWSKAYVIFFLP